MSNRVLSLLSILTGAAFFLSAVFFAGTTLRFLRWDLTEENLYTLSEGTKSVLSKIDEPITLRLFYSEDLAADIGLDNFGRRVTELLAEFENAADGDLVVQIISPEQYSEQEELATGLGVRGQMINAQGDMFFFGLAATNSVDDLETIPSLNPSQESFLEYELAKLIWKLSNPEPLKLAVLTSLPLQGGAGANPFGQPEPGWRVTEVLRDTFEVEFLAAELAEPIDEEVDALLVVHPKGLSETARYAIDQYALGGGKVCALVDPYCFFDQPPPGQRGPVDNSSRLDSLLEAWGVKLTQGTVIGDLAMAQVLRARSGLIPFPVWMEVNGRRDEAVFSQDDVVTSALKLVTMLTAGELSAAEEASTTFTPLIQTTTGGRGIDSGQLPPGPDLLSIAPQLYQRFLLHAEGSIEFTGLPEDGATLTLSDGLRAPVTFEFTTDAEVAEGNTGVALAQASTPEEVAQGLRMQLMVANLSATADSGLGIEASGTGARIELMTQEPGPQGEVEIRRSGRLEATVDGMEIRGLRKTLAARVQGPIATTFPEGAPPDWTGTEPHLDASTADFNGIVVADADFVHEQFWSSQVQQGGFVMQRMNDNPTVLVNALENLCGSNDLLSLRSRGVERRPFERKEELNREADERFQAKADELAKKEQKLGKEIGELEEGADEEGVIRISNQELQELRDKQQELAETRRELGRVEGDKKREMKALGDRLFLVNIATAPALVALLGLLYGLSVASRRKSK